MSSPPDEAPIRFPVAPPQKAGNFVERNMKIPRQQSKMQPEHIKLPLVNSKPLEAGAEREENIVTNGDSGAPTLPISTSGAKGNDTMAYHDSASVDLNPDGGKISRSLPACAKGDFVDPIIQPEDCWPISQHKSAKRQQSWTDYAAVEEEMEGTGAADATETRPKRKKKI